MAITKYSVDDYEEMIRLGVLTERDRVELIRGEIIPKMAIGPRHSTCVKGLNQLLTQRAAGRAIVGVQDPVRLPDSEPEPDISLVRPPKERCLTIHPQPADIFLVVEVADSTLDDDRNIMRPLYAESGIQEFWIANLRDNCLEVYRGPRPDGTYQENACLAERSEHGHCRLAGFRARGGRGALTATIHPARSAHVAVSSGARRPSIRSETQKPA